MFAKVLASILLSELAVTCVAAAVFGIDGNDHQVVKKQVVRIAKACPAGTSRGYCTVDVQAYSRYNSTTCLSANEGHVKLNGKTVWSAGWCSSLDNLRGITVVDVDTNSCTANSVRQFDTHESEMNAAALVTYLQQLPPGVVIVGVTGDEPTEMLEPALEILQSIGIDVADVHNGGNFAFVFQKDYSFQPVVVKGLDVNATPAKIDLQLEEECGILLQQHFGGTTFFNRSWAEYKAGFGVETSNYWMGNDRMHNLTADGNFKLRVELLSKYNSEWYWAEYKTFRVMGESSSYVLYVDGYSGTSGNSLRHNNGMRFSTRDRDRDIWCESSCTTEVTQGNNAGFWFAVCSSAYVNSPIRDGGYWGFTWTSLPINGPAPDVFKLVISRMYLVTK